LIERFAAPSTNVGSGSEETLIFSTEWLLCSLVDDDLLFLSGQFIQFHDFTLLSACEHALLDFLSAFCAEHGVGWAFFSTAFAGE
jgi:hypothetical protein